MDPDRAIVGLYVHIPFCSLKCFYCDFAAFSGQKKTVSRYLDALRAEAALLPRRIPETLYIGGGTPSELDAGQIERLFTLVRESYPESEFREITFEANPESIDAEKLLVLRRRGVTRLSLGLQTADAALLKSIGRRHSPEDFFSVFQAARDAGGMALSVDLMYGLPGQDMASLKDSLLRVLALEPEHLSLYGLQVEDRTLFFKRGVQADEDSGREMYETSLDMISRAGLRRYEISNFARPGFESIHNRIYWRGGEYLGLGCGAASYLDGVRSSNTDRLAAYCEAVERGERPLAESERLSGKEKLGEEILLGLRLAEGVELSQESEDSFRREWRELRESGLVERSGRRVRLSHDGTFVANEVFSRFVRPFPASRAGME